jgi:hypothetical protein
LSASALASLEAQKENPAEWYDGAFLLEEPWRLSNSSHGRSFLANQVSASKELPTKSGTSAARKWQRH